MGKVKVWFSWSSGKDSAYALWTLMKDPNYDVTGLFTTVTDEFKRVSMHSVREELLDEQAKRIGLPLYKVRIPYPCSNEDYENKMRALIDEAHAKQVTTMAFGDLYLEDIRDYRLKQLKPTGIKALFPIWGKDTTELAQLMIEQGFKTIITCIDQSKLENSFSGREFDKEFLSSLPEGVDHCGENGEFHSFVYDSPLYAKPINVEVGEQRVTEGFTFTDVIPALS